MIYILSDLINFIELFVYTPICDYDIKIYNNDTYKTISFMMKENKELKCGVPYICLFDNEDYIDSIIHDYVKYNPFYDKDSGCFIFPNINIMIRGCFEILKKVRDEHPLDDNIKDKYNLLDCFMKKVYKEYNRCEVENELSNLFEKMC